MNAIRRFGPGRDPLERLVPVMNRCEPDLALQEDPKSATRRSPTVAAAAYHWIPAKPQGTEAKQMVLEPIAHGPVPAVVSGSRPRRPIRHQPSTPHGHWEAQAGSQPQAGLEPQTVQPGWVAMSGLEARVGPRTPQAVMEPTLQRADRGVRLRALWKQPGRQPLVTERPSRSVIRASASVAAPTLARRMPPLLPGLPVGARARPR